MTDQHSRLRAYIGGADPKMYPSSEKKCGVCGGVIDGSTLYYIDPPDIFVHANAWCCAEEFQKTISMYRQIQNANHIDRNFISEKIVYAISTMRHAINMPFGRVARYILKRGIQRLTKPGPNWKDLIKE